MLWLGWPIRTYYGPEQEAPGNILNAMVFINDESEGDHTEGSDHKEDNGDREGRLVKKLIKLMISR